MPDLYPTLVRLALLADVEAGAVRDDDNGVPHLQWCDEDGNHETVRVEARMREMAAAGWVEPGDVNTWQLTAAGLRVRQAATNA